MRVLALLFVLLSMPVLAGEYTPWPDSDEPAGWSWRRRQPDGQRLRPAVKAAVAAASPRRA